MRYLKIYEEYSGGIFNSEEVDDILDVFQDIIDEYNLEKKSGDGFMRNNQYKISFVSNAFKSGKIIRILITISSHDMKDDDIDDIIERYSNMGFNAYISYRGDIWQSTNNSLLYTRLEITKNP